MKKRIVAVLAMVLVFTLVFSGCSLGRKLAQSITDKATVAATVKATVKPTVKVDVTNPVVVNTAKADTTIFDGSFQGNIYSNDFLGMKLQVPANWYVKDSAEVVQMLEDMGTPTDDNIPYLFAAFKAPYQSTTDFNDNVICNGELILQDGEMLVKTSMEYMNISVSGLEESGYTIISGAAAKTYNGIDVATVTAQMDQNGTKLYQQFFSFLAGDYAINIVVSSASMAGLNVCQPMLESLTFYGN